MMDYEQGDALKQKCMLAYYSWSNNTLLWYKKICFHIFEIMIHNGHKMFCKFKNDGDRKMALLHFRIAVVHHLLEENFRRESPMVHLLPDEIFFHLAPIPATGTKSKPTRKCRVCTKNLVRKETR